MNKKNKILIIIISLIVLIGIYLLYNTYALTTKTTNNGDYYTINLTDSNIVSLAANEEKTVIYQINNTNNGTVSYGVAYNNSNVAVKVYSDSKDKVTGTIGANDNKYVKLHLKNKTSSNTTVEITTVMGYENGGNLIVPSDSTLVTKTYTNSFAGYITELYDNSIKTPVTNNSITYQYDTTNNLMQDIAGNTRYYGASPKNYIYFNCDSYPSTNCELWRIIGVFDGKVKLIRNESIGKYSWDNKNTTTGAETAYGKNDWTTARLMKLLNPSTYYTTDTNDNGKGQSLYWNATSGTCYSGQNNATKSCNFTSTGIKNDVTRNMIAETTWNLGGWNSSKIFSNEMYEKERGTTVYSGRSTTWAGKIALAYPSDYGYATDLSKCFQVLHNYDDNTCKSNDWMYSIITNSGNDYGWLLFPHKNYAYSVLRVSVSGYARNYGYASATEGVVPVLYLNSNQSIAGGDGSQNNPYQLKA